MRPGGLDLLREVFVDFFADFVVDLLLLAINLTHCVIHLLPRQQLANLLNPIRYLELLVSELVQRALLQQPQDALLLQVRHLNKIDAVAEGVHGLEFLGGALFGSWYVLEGRVVGFGAVEVLTCGVLFLGRWMRHYLVLFVIGNCFVKFAL